jgi:L-ascorbate metabolism protein UlaG (beta-lactamase superfamily)
MKMTAIEQHQVLPTQAALWFLGQAGYVIRAGGVTVAIDPYLSDSAAANAPEFRRRFAPPIAPENFRVDLYLVTHDHLDHLDPETLRRYRHPHTTQFVAPRLASRKLVELGVPPANIRRLDSGESWTWRDVTIVGTFALPTGPDVLDTAGYSLEFSNGRSVYHASDTAFTPLLLQAAPKAMEVALVPINGKWGNLNVEQAADLAAAVGPRYVFPNHYDLMVLNAENPETFRWFCQQRKLRGQCVIPAVMKPFIWE